MNHMAVSKWIVSGACVLLGAGCAALVADRHTYEPEAASPSVVVNGAQIRMRMKTEGTEDGAFAISAMVVTAGKATFDGPFRWRVDAIGKAGSHEWIQVHRIRTRTATTRRDEWYPQRHLGERAVFRQVDDGFRASYRIPGMLNVKPREDGALDVLVDLTVRADGRSVRRVAQFRLGPAHKEASEFVFFPAEIVENIGKSPEDWDDSGWD